METELEVKFYPIDKDKTRKKLKKIGAKLVFSERKMRRAIVDSRTKKNASLKVEYIRVRDEGDMVRLSAKNHAKKSGKLADQEELDVEVSDYGKMVKIMELMGFIIDRYQETLRETWEYGGTEIYIDTWPWIQPRLEIEGKSEKEIRGVAEELGFKWKNKIITGMTSLYMKKYKISEKEFIKKVSHLTFENNPFDDLKAS